VREFVYCIAYGWFSGYQSGNGEPGESDKNRINKKFVKERN
jgi:hypothetical protein